MARRTPYETDKVFAHANHISNLSRMLNGEGEPLPPVSIQLMPNNSCNHRCSFCSYGHWTKEVNENNKKWKNTHLYNTKNFIPWPKMLELIQSWKEMGVKGIELLGGGEPLMYPHIDELLTELINCKFDLSLTSNGTMINEHLADLIASGMLGVRLSIDAGSVETYTRLRQVSETQWNRVLHAIKMLRDRKKSNGIHLSIGYVVGRENAREIYQAAQLFADSGVDSMRISLAFTPYGTDYFSDTDLREARAQASRAQANFNGSSFMVINQLEHKLELLRSRHQDYRFCAQQSLCVVVGADQNIYTCCMLAYNKLGLMGSIQSDDFLSAWNKSLQFRRKFDPSVRCKNECNYEIRNKKILSVIQGKTPPADPKICSLLPHVNLL